MQESGVRMDLRHFFINQIWWGKLLCACLGFLIAGPVGAFFGIFIGNFFDRGLAEHFANPLWHFHAERRPAVKSLFLSTTFAMLGHIAKADGRVSEQDIQMAKTLMRDMNLNREQQNHAQKCFNEGKKEQFNPNKMLDSLQSAAKDNPNLLKLFINTQYKAAQIDGLSEKKIHIMNTILKHMHCAPIHKQTRFNDDFYDRSNGYRQQSSSSSAFNPDTNNTLAGAYTILQVQPTSTKQDIKQAYRRLISRNHPDKLIAQGMSKEKIKQANEKTQIIRKAYEQICASKGW